MRHSEGEGQSVKSPRGGEVGGAHNFCRQAGITLCRDPRFLRKPGFDAVLF